MLILVQELMHRTYVEIHGEAPKRHETPKPCDHFDLIVGTGTGGLIAIMLGRLRLDLETCKSVYVRMTRRVFETDKTFAGIPFKSTLFKASKLEEAIRDCVREHTIFDDEGNDNLAMAQDITTPASPHTPASAWSGPDGIPARSGSTASRPMSIGPGVRGPTISRQLGDPNTLLYDVREKRTKTYVGICRNHDQANVSQSYHCCLQKQPQRRTSSNVAFVRLATRGATRVQLHNLASRSSDVSDGVSVQTHTNRTIGLHR